MTNFAQNGICSIPSLSRDHQQRWVFQQGLARCRITELTSRLHLLKDDRIPNLNSQHHTAHRGAGRKGEWVEPAECPSKSHHCCRCWGGTSATEVRKKGAPLRGDGGPVLGWAKVIREWLPTMGSLRSSWKYTDCNMKIPQYSPYHFWITFGEFRCLVLRRLAVYHLKIWMATTLSSIHQLTSLQMLQTQGIRRLKLRKNVLSGRSSGANLLHFFIVTEQTTFFWSKYLISKSNK